MKLIKKVVDDLKFAAVLLSLLYYTTNFKSYLKLWITSGKNLTLNFKKGLRIKITHRMDAFVIKEVLVDRIYDVNLENPTNVIDIGAHIGLFSLFQKIKYPNANIIAYEPNIDTFRLLSFNIKINKKNIKAVQAGVAGKTGTRILYKNILSPTSSFLNTANTYGKDKVKTYSFVD